MNFDIVSMKQRAKYLLRDTKPSPLISGMIFALIGFLYVLISMAFLREDTFILWQVLTGTTWVLLVFIKVSIQWYCLRVSREDENNVGNIFLAFQKKQVSVLFLGILKSLLFTLGCLFFFVGALFPFYWFRFSEYILYDEEVSFWTAMKKSKELLKGHYLELIKLDISNLLWLALPMFSAFIGAYYAIPYTSIVYAEFYEYLKGQKEILE